jgi:hypothetical protein
MLKRPKAIKATSKMIFLSPATQELCRRSRLWDLLQSSLLPNGVVSPKRHRIAQKHLAQWLWKHALAKTTKLLVVSMCTDLETPQFGRIDRLLSPHSVLPGQNVDGVTTSSF